MSVFSAQKCIFDAIGRGLGCRGVLCENIDRARSGAAGDARRAPPRVRLESRFAVVGAYFVRIDDRAFRQGTHMHCKKVEQ